MTFVRLRIALSVLGVAFITAHLAWPSLKVDSITVALLAIAILPWFAGIVSSVDLPGIGKITFPDLEKAFAPLRNSSGQLAQTLEVSSTTELDLDLVSNQHKPNLALLAIRFEVEKRLRKLARKHNITDKFTPGINEMLELRGLITREQKEGLNAVLYASSQAADGAKVDQEVVDVAKTWAAETIAFLEQKLAA